MILKCFACVRCYCKVTAKTEKYINAKVLPPDRKDLRVKNMSIPNQVYEPSINAEYIPRLYRYEHPQAYYSKRMVPAITNYGPVSGYSFLSDSTPKAQPDQPQTVEQIITNGYFSAPPGDPVTAVISDKKHTSWLGLDDIIGQIRQRYALYEKNIYEIEWAKCGALNVFFVHEDHNRPAPPDDRIYYSLNKNLQRLYQDQREERVNLWRDISRLRQLLPETAQQYLAAYRKVSILEDYKGGGS